MVDDIANILKTRQVTNLATAELNLAEYREDPDKPGELGVRSVLPDVITMEYSHSTVRALNEDTVIENSSIEGSEIPNQKTTNYSLGFQWDWPIGPTGLILTRSELDNRQVGFETADTDDDFVEISQGWSSGIWNATARLGVGRFHNAETTARSVTQRYEAGLQVDLEPEEWPSLSLAVDVSMVDDKSKVEETRSLENSWSGNATLNFSKFIPRYLSTAAGFSPYFTVTGLVQDTDLHQTGTASTGTYSWSISFAAGFSF